MEEGQRKLIYEESARGIEHQAAGLENLRSAAGTLLSAASIVSSSWECKRWTGVDCPAQNATKMAGSRQSDRSARILHKSPVLAVAAERRCVVRAELVYPAVFEGV